MASLAGSGRGSTSEGRLGKHDYEWFAEEDLLRQVPVHPAATRLCQNWVQCGSVEPVVPPTKGAASEADGEKKAVLLEVSLRLSVCVVHGVPVHASCLVAALQEEKYLINRILDWPHRARLGFPFRKRWKSMRH